ncbi:DUF4352 domain-containing protein [Microbacterium sp. H1-D42]|uniref:DUF4352 domain-containing protein n=1 Tax=Microbacterium sp. H1-D42 TaxID=2925844 RepID=UPI001F5306DB|nr:DUF4352 domain-containing protein [Microbacterium sp. H1-D42]UNK71325.1 DUF4352 domain-containing protein [Microbacterium sp. H1-D42]
MTISKRAVRTHVVTWGTTAALLAGAWVLNAVALPENAPQTGIVVAGEAGAPTSTRNLVVTVDDVRAARSVADADGWTAEGTWLIVDISAQAIDTQVGARLGLADLVIGERTFRATERGQTFSEAKLVPGVPRSGSLAFELPPDALAGDAVLRFSPVAFPNLDGMIEIPVDLDAVPIETQVTLRATDWTKGPEATQ